MIAYVDSSILLRVVLRESDALRQWSEIERGITSALTEIECLRVLDRLRLEGNFTDETLSRARESALQSLESFETVQMTEAIVTRAAQPMPVVIGPLDAIHLATVLLWREAIREEPVLATHDRILGLAARAFGFQVVGV